MSHNTIKSSFIGHKGRCFDTRVSHDQKTFISASEDGTAKIWNLETMKCEQTLKHNVKSEVLRSTFLGSTMFCTGGSDGNVIVWMRSSEPVVGKCTKVRTLKHNSDESQIYACEPMSCGSTGLITAADSQLLLWDVESNSDQCMQSWDFVSLDGAGDICSSVPFGGPRNEHNDVYVFDAKASPTQSSCVAVALSDSSIRLLDTRERPVSAVFSVLSLNDPQKYPNANFGHATAVSWSSNSHSLLVSLGSGKVVVIDNRMNLIRSVLAGHSKAAYGASFAAEDDARCITWSSDGSVLAWDLRTATGVCTDPTNSVAIADFPIFTCASVAHNGKLICGGGGGSSNSFLGTPIHQVSSPLAL